MLYDKRKRSLKDKHVGQALAAAKRKRPRKRVAKKKAAKKKAATPLTAKK